MLQVHQYVRWIDCRVLKQQPSSNENGVSCNDCYLFCPEFLPPQIHPTIRWLDYKSSHTMAPSHSGFFLFNYYNLQGSCQWTVIQPLTETAGLLISWGFSFLPRTIPTATDQQGGVSFQTTPMGKITHTHSPRTGVESSKTYPRVRISVQSEDWYTI